MKQVFVAGNWKSNKTIDEAKVWLHEWNDQCQMSTIPWKKSTVVLCAPFIALALLQQEIEALKSPLQLGGQDVSPFPDGAYTGEVSARMVKEIADWVIIGHSERRKYFNETDEVLHQKVIQAKTVGLKVIYCVPDETTVVPIDVDVIAYEPVWAIGTGKSDTPDNAARVITSIKQKTRKGIVIYGGSVTPENVLSFVSQSSIDGVLPGGVSLNPIKFMSLVTQASSLT